MDRIHSGAISCGEHLVAVPCCRAGGHNPSGDHRWCPLTPIKQHCTMWAASHSGWKTRPIFAKSLGFKDFCFYCHLPVCSCTQSFPGFLPVSKKKKKKIIAHPPLLSQPVPDFFFFFSRGQRYSYKVSVGVKTSKYSFGHINIFSLLFSLRYTYATHYPFNVKFAPNLTLSLHQH